MRKIEAVLCTLGTRGDILPFVALGSELRRRGYNVTLMSNENWQPLVKGNGIAFHPIAPQDPSQSGRDDYLFFKNNTLPSFKRSFDIVKAKVVEAGRDLILIYRSNMLGMECAAEVFGLKHVKVAIQPSAIRSFERPPWPLTPLATGHFQSIFKRLIIPALYKLAEITRRYRRHTNRFRRLVGVTASRATHPTTGSENATIVFAPAWYAMPQIDWPKNCHCVGFPFHDGNDIDADVAAFIDKHGPPIVFTPGTGVADTEAFFDKAEAIARYLNMPAIFLSKGAQPRQYSASILVCSYADMAWLLKQTKIIIHHGGIGTTAQALRAGVPQIILPDRFDQPDNAQRIARLGLGGAVMKDVYSPEKWVETIQQVLDSTVIRQRLKNVSADIQRNSAIITAADLVQSVLERTMP
jgi:rhamnosyltransferase subunit B